jgi:large subunit ribosomal protein L33
MAGKGKGKGKKGKKKAETVFLVCEETGDYNYAVRRKPGGEKLQLSKYCPRLRKHTLHNERKK